MSILLFTTPSCVFCPQAKKLLSEKKEVIAIDASTQEGLDTARKHRILKVPSVVVVNDQGLVDARYEGIGSIVSFCSSHGNL